MSTLSPEQIKFTICFAKQADNILLLYRNKRPNMHKWNGLGGKIEPDETPDESIYREVLEESTIDLKTAQSVKYTGIVTWNSQNQAWERGGMHTYIAQLPTNLSFSLEKYDPREGKLSWKPLSWILNPKNNRVVPNIRKFLPHMLQTDKPHEYQVTYYNRQITNFRILPF